MVSVRAICGEVGTRFAKRPEDPSTFTKPCILDLDHEGKHDWAIREDMQEAVEHPPHYTSHPSGVECITVTEHMTFNLGNAVKYIWRAGSKGDALQDLRKAAWYVQREIDRLTPKG